MKKLFLTLIVALFSLNVVIAQNSKKSLVTKSMADKISEMCLLNRDYTLPIFYFANAKKLSSSDILAGKGREILFELYNYPEYAENFICEIFNRWDIEGLKNIGFNDEEILISKEIIEKAKK